MPFYRRNLYLAMPVVLSQVGQVTVTLVDTMMVGHVGTVELAASSFANNVFMIGMLFGMGITYGITPLIGNDFGNGRMKEVSIWLKNGIATHVAVAFALSGGMFAIYFFLPFMGQKTEVLELARPYYLLLCLSYIPFLMFFTIKQFFEGVGNTKMAMQITLLANLINIVLNYVFIFGKLGFPAMGLNGAGIGTLVSRVVMPAMFIVYIVRKPRFLHYFLAAHRQAFDWNRVLAVLKIGIPIGFQIIVEVSAFGIGAIMMGWLGEIPLAAHQVAIGMASFAYMISLGVSQANTIRVSHQMGIGDFPALKNAAYASTHLVLAFMLFTGIVFVVFRRVLPYLFTTDTEVIELAANLLIIAAVFQLFDGLQVVMLSTLRGMADVKIPMFMAFLAYLFIGMPVSYVCAFLLNFGPPGIWLGYLAGLSAAGIMFYFRFQQHLRKFM